MDWLGSLSERLPSGAVVTDPAEVGRRSVDWSALGLLRRARGEPAPEPAAVVFASSTADVAAVLAWAFEAGAEVVPRGGGSGVCGGAEAPNGSVVLDLTRMDRILEVDEVSQVVRVQAGIRGDRLESALGERGLTLGHYPQSIALSTVGGWIAASSSGQASAGFGAIEDLLLGATVVLAGGRVVDLRAVPRSAAGPDLRHLIVGSEGTLGVVTEASLACSAVPAGLAWDAVRFDRFEDCMAWARAVEKAGVGAAILRAWDEVDSALAFGRLGHQGGCVAVLGFDDGLPGLTERRRATAEAARAVGGSEPGLDYGPHWWEHRNDAVDLYRRIMGPDRAFGTGVVVDTMEVAALWGKLPDLYRGVREAMAAHSEAVGCHLSHVYPSGSSLYFTFLVRGSDDHDAERRYLALWDEAVAACLTAGGTMTHHHGVGRLKARFLEAELGPEGLSMLRSIKQALDPNGVLNPGALVPQEQSRSPGKSVRGGDVAGGRS